MIAIFVEFCKNRLKMVLARHKWTDTYFNPIGERKYEEP
jgi:hypothetical protein